MKFFFLIKESKRVIFSLLGIFLTVKVYSLSWESIDLDQQDLNYLSSISQQAQAVYAIDFNSHSVLFQKNAYDLFNPASLTKIVVLDLAYDYIKSHNIHLESLVPISAKADFRAAPPHSSLMFLQKGQKVTLGEILKGIAVDSGNDATVALGEFIAGSEEKFIDMMNKHVQKMGFKDMHFVDTSGYSPSNKITAYEMALFSYNYIQKHPQALKELHSLKTFSFPQSHNGGDRSLPFAINQENRNYLLGSYEGADGLKTGYIDEIGFNLVATAERKGRRILVCLIGISAKGMQEGSQKRAYIASSLMNFFFNSYQQILLPQIVGHVRILGGEVDSLPLSLAEPTYLLFRKDKEKGALNKVIHLNKDRKFLVAPLNLREKVGYVSLLYKGKVIRNIDLVVSPTSYKGSLKLGWDYLKYFLHSFFIVFRK